jgi:hypothetical protein
MPGAWPVAVTVCRDCPNVNRESVSIPLKKMGPHFTMVIINVVKGEHVCVRGFLEPGSSVVLGSLFLAMGA